MQSNKTMIRIFISHSHSDEVIVNKLVNFLLPALEIKEEEIFCSSDPDQGLDYRFTGVPNQLKEKLKNSEALIVLITSDSLHSTWIPFEAGTFWTTGKPIIPILGPGLTHDNLPGPLRSLLSIPIDEKDWKHKVNNAINQLVAQLKIEQKVSKRRDDALREFYDSLRAWQPKPQVKASSQQKPAEDREWILSPYSESQNPDFFKKVTELIPKTQKITMIGTGLNIIWQQKIVDLLIKHARQNNTASITICLANPFSPHVEDRLTEEEISGVPAPVGKKGIVRNILNLMARLKTAKYPSNFKVCLFENYPTFATLIFDENIFIYPYTYKTLGTYSPIFHLKDNGSEETNFFMSNAENIIKDAIPAEDFVKIYQDPRYYSEEWIAAAVYLIPEKNQPFYKFGSAILGYNILEQTVLKDKRIVNSDYVGEASNFGFHATIGDALYFVNQAEIDRVKAELKMLAEKIPPFTLQELEIVDRYNKEGDIVIHCEDKSGVSEAIHSELIHCFYRSAISSTYRAEQTEKLSMVKNSARAKFMINKYGSPYILQEFNLHFTLCTSPPSEKLLRTQLVTKLKEKFNTEVSSDQVEINKICLLVRGKNDERWKIEKTYTLRGR